MIPQVHIRPHASRTSKCEVSAFARGPRERPLRIFIDIDSYSPIEPLLQELLGFSENRNVEITPIRLAQIKMDEDGHATVDLSKGQRSHVHFVRHVGHNISAIQSWYQNEALATGSLAKRMALMMCAERNDCDALVTECDEVYRVTEQAHEASNAMSLQGAFAVLGLQLRLREDFVMFQAERSRVQTNGSDFYLALSAALVTESTRWSDACPEPENAFEGSSAGLARAVVQRFARAMRARDRVHGHLFRVASEASIDNAQFYFEGFLVALAGAFDAAARVAQRVYQLSGPPRPSWRAGRWRDRLIAADPAFADVLADGSQVRATVDALFILRNLIHEEPMGLVGIVGVADHFTACRAAVPTSEKRTFSRAIQVLGGPDAWGIDRMDNGVWTLDVGRYVEVLVPLAVEALNTLMKLVKVERLGGSGRPQPVVLPVHDAARLRLLGGLE